MPSSKVMAKSEFSPWKNHSSFLPGDFKNLAKFFIEDQPYLVVAETACEKIFSSEAFASNLCRGDVVGEFKKNNEKYVIIALHGDIPDVLSYGLVNILTKREIQIVTLVAEGRVNKEIADRLQISEWTVSTHLRRIFAKLGVDSRAAMIFRCARLVLT